MPALSPTMEEGKLAKWLVKEGDTVRSGDILAEIETDKATMEFEAVDEGKIGQLLVPEGTEGVKVNAPIATLLADGEKPDAKVDIPSAMESIKSAVSSAAPKAEKPVAAAPKPAAEVPKPAAAQAPAKAEGERTFASPLARRIAEQKGVDLASIAGSGPRGRIVKADVENARADIKPAVKPDAAKAPAAQPAGAASISGIAPLPDARAYYKPEDYEEIPHDTMRKTIARRLTSAKTLIPHYYLTIDCRIDELMAMRARLNATSPKENGFKLSVNDFVVKASALALKRVPEVNASWTETAMLRHKHADVGVAVALDFGLITPIVTRAEEKGLAAISNEVKSLAERARAKKLKPSEFEGGGFSISNLGMFGIKQFTAVINPPQSAILAVGAGEKRAVVVGDKVEIATVMTCTLSCDHRVIDGATGARFLDAFRTFIEEPASMLL
ncbi:MAG TPA: pyruvate dehydrogenase complex dihydrolipoamide acetyltransferase [Rhizomicrobium sp.]|jgi:pyruvate dehydrogenase E2 component (dihydrolipoamide acetyltransferase)|nr:pyruvate dehydrogenase complex dihydrolipoamide acetyltransferase [Rhizomicrobium sp.]